MKYIGGANYAQYQRLGTIIAPDGGFRMAKWAFSGRKPKLAQNLTFLDCQIDSVDFLVGPKAFLELVDVQLTRLKQVHHDFWKMPKKLHPYYIVVLVGEKQPCLLALAIFSHKLNLLKAGVQGGII